MKRIIKTLFIAILAVTAAGCTEKGPEGTKTELNQNIQFTFDEPEVDGTTVRITVNHDGAATDTWYYFCTDDLDTDDMKIISDGVAAILAEDGSVDVYSSTRKTIKPKDLEPQTDYRFIVIGLTAEGTVYGAPASVEFTTGRGEMDEIPETDEWKISYERGENEGEKVELITIECAETSRYYLDLIMDYYITDVEGNVYIKEYVQMVADDVQTYLNAGYGIDELTAVGGGTFAIPRQEKGNYYVFCIGYDDNGTPTGYSVKMITVVEEEATEEYLQWIGEYTVTSANGITYTLDFQHYDNNFAYAVLGWECGSSLSETGMDFGTAFDTQLAFPVYFVDGKIAFNEFDITALTVTDQNGTEVPCYLGLYGYDTVTAEDLSLMLTGGMTLATASTTDGAATATIIGNELQFENGSVTCAGLGYAAIAEDYSTYFLWNQPAQLPISMTKITSSGTNAAPKLMMKRKAVKSFEKGKTLKTNIKPAYKKAL